MFSLVLRTQTHAHCSLHSQTVIEWTDNAMWLVEPEYRSWEMQHIFFWAKSVFGMWEARVGNASWGGVMPPLDEVMLS